MSIVDAEDRERGRDRRAFVERLRAWPGTWRPADRVLVEQVYGQGQRMSDLALVMCKPAARVRRDVCKLSRCRLRKEDFRLAVGLGHLLPGDLREPVTRVVLQGRERPLDGRAWMSRTTPCGTRLAVALATLRTLEETTKRAGGQRATRLRNCWKFSDC